jgi:hypothetical protein
MKKVSLFILLLGIMSGTCIVSCKSAPANSQEIEAKEPSSRERDCMERVIALDSEYGDIRNHESETSSLSETILNYVTSMEGYNFKDCPEAFRLAFRNHRNAWNAIRPIADTYPDLRGEMHELFKVIEEGDRGEIFKEKLKNIWDTWAEVEAAMK